MRKVLEGHLVAKQVKIAICVSRFNEFITQKLVGGAVDTFIRHDGNQDNIDIIWVPGSFEIPLITKKVVETKKYDAVIAIGAIIRGSTPHFDFVASEATKGIAQVSLESGIPVIFSILTTDNLEQAIERAGVKAGNKGSEAMLTALEMVDLIKKIPTL